MSAERDATPGRLAGCLALLRRDLRVWRRFAWASAAGDLAEPLLYLLALGYGLGGLVGEVAGMSYIRFLAPGLVASATLYTASFEATYGTFTRMVPQRTFEGVLATPIGPAEVGLAEVLFATVKAAVAGTAVLLVTCALGLCDHPAAALAPLVCLLAGLVFGGLAVLYTCLSPAYDFFNYYFTLFVTPMVLFSGVFFPLDQLPGWARTLAWASPLTHAAASFHHLFAGRLGLDLVFELVWLAVAACLPLWPVTRLMRRRLVR